MNVLELKIKNKHLAEEARIIKFEEKKLLKRVDYKRKKHVATGANDPYEQYKDPNWNQYCKIRNHRNWEVRFEQRATFLTRAFLKGIPYKAVERTVHDKSLFSIFVKPKIYRMAAKYGKFDKNMWEWKNNHREANAELRDLIDAWIKGE